MFMNTQSKIILIVIILLAISLRFFRISEVPPAISWDEAAVGYNAWTLANFGQDEYGNSFPLVFKSFGEYKNPVDIYVTAISVKLFGLSDFSMRLPSALFGVFNVLLLFFLAKALLNNNFIALSAAFFLSISPMNIHFSHFNHEANLALFFFMLGLLLFILTIRGEKLLIFALICFILSLLSYNAPKVFIPVFVFFLIIIYRKELLKLSRQLLFSICLIVFFSLFLFLNPHALGIERAAQTALGREEIEKTELFKSTKSNLLGRINLTFNQYISHFSLQYLFISGDKNPRLSAQVTGEFYYIDIVFLFSGIIFIFRKRLKELLVVLFWALIAPLPGSLAAEAPHAGRAMFMMGSWQIISAIGFYSIISLFRKKAAKLIVIIVSLVIFGFLSFNFLSYYFGQYARRYAIEWQYGMKQIVEFIKSHQEYHVVYMTDVRYQPYIFFLYYLKTPLPDYLRSVIYNNNKESNDYNNVFFFDKYFFGGWDSVESMPKRNVLYVLTPSQYDGLRYRLQFDIKEIIYYPNETVAFYLVSI